MSIYGIGFILAAVLYFYYALKEHKTLKSHHLIMAILAGIFSWIGVIVMIAVIKKD